MSETSKTEKMFVRFSPFRRAEHLLGIATFFALVLTGLPQKFPQARWSLAILDSLGGLSFARSVHRLFGLLLIVQFSLHIGIGLWLIWKRRCVPLLAPNLQDVRDDVLSFKNSLGLEKKEPKFGRFNFRQKFDYWGMIVGGFVMISTGLILWKPILASTVLPAELIPVSRIAHSNEAFLAFLVILFWHLYSVTLNPEVFPLDTSIFTGKISEHRMRKEHPREQEKEP